MRVEQSLSQPPTLLAKAPSYIVTAPEVAAITSCFQRVDDSGWTFTGLK